MGIDARLLIETLTHIEAESVGIEFTGAVAPVAFKPIGEEGHICLIHPMRLES